MNSPWKPPAQMPNRTPNPFDGTYNIPIPTGNPVHTQVDVNGRWMEQPGMSAPQQPVPQTTAINFAPSQPTMSWDASMFSPPPMDSLGRKPGSFQRVNMPQQMQRQARDAATRASLSPQDLLSARAFGNDWAFAPGEDQRMGRWEAAASSMFAPSAPPPILSVPMAPPQQQAPQQQPAAQGQPLADFARDQVQRNVHNPAVSMMSQIPALAQMSTPSDAGSLMGLGNRWQNVAQQHNRQNMDVTLATEPIEQQLARYGLAAQSGVSHADLMRRMQETQERARLAQMAHGLTTAQAIYGE